METEVNNMDARQMLSFMTEEYLAQSVETIGTIRQGYEKILAAEEREASSEYQGLVALEGLTCDVYREVTEHSALDE